MPAWICLCGLHHCGHALVCSRCADTQPAAAARALAEQAAGRGELANWQREKLEHLAGRWRRGELD